MAAYAAVISLRHTITRLVDPRHFSPPPHSEYETMIKGARDEIDSLQHALEFADRGANSMRPEEKVRAWDLGESHMCKLFPREYPIVQFAYKDIVSLHKFLGCTRVDASDGRIREAICGLVDFLQSVVPSELSVEELERAKREINSFTQTVKKINGHEDDGNKKSSNMVVLCDEFPKGLLPGIKQNVNKVLIHLLLLVRRLDMSRSERSRERVNALEVRIREAVSEVDDLLESRLSNQFLISQSDDQDSLQNEKTPLPFPMDLQEVEKYIPPFTQLVRKLKHEYVDELIDPLPEIKSNHDDGIISSQKLSGKKGLKMVGIYDEVAKIKNKLIVASLKLDFITLYGMAGIGKTRVAREVFEYPSVLKRFELRAWVDVGQSYQLKRIMQNILAQVSSENVDELLTKEDDERLVVEYLHRSLNTRRYLIVLDDVWDYSVFSDMKRLFPDDNNGSRVVLTTRLRRVAYSNNMHEMRFMSKEESWDLLRQEVFGEESCPPQLEKAGKKIAENCEGLPLTIVIVGELLAKVNKNLENWNKLSANPTSLLEDAYDQMLRVLLPSYNYLLLHLKVCFLYMGTFPRNYEIPPSELIKLWVAEKLFQRDVDKSEFHMMIEELFYNSLLMPGRRSPSLKIKTWSLHSAFWHLCKKEGWKNKFSHVIERFRDTLSEIIKSQRRLCVHNNVLFGIKDVYKSMKSVSTARSLLCTGQPHQYPVPICFDLRLLRVLNALTIRLYEFPVEVLRLVELKYLSITCYGNPPSNISKLRNLQFLIIHRHLSVSTFGATSYLPVAIWDLKELIHLQVMGSDLPDPYDGASLPNLVKLLDISAHSCTKGVFEGTPNLKKLRIHIELAPDGSGSFRCFDHIHNLKKLKSLRCVVVNPTFGSEADIAPPLSNFPSSLEKLCLSGLGYPWDDMSVIATLPNLRALKLRCYAFRGPKWEIENNGFPKLIFLEIEDTDLVRWTYGRGSMPKLLYIFLKGCYKLETIPRASISQTIELVHCNPSAVTDAQQYMTKGYYESSNLRSSSDDRSVLLLNQRN